MTFSPSVQQIPGHRPRGTRAKESLLGTFERMALPKALLRAGPFWPVRAGAPQLASQEVLDDRLSVEDYLVDQPHY
jgi:hypothetical protein